MKNSLIKNTVTILSILFSAMTFAQTTNLLIKKERANEYFSQTEINKSNLSYKWETRNELEQESSHFNRIEFLNQVEKSDGSVIIDRPAYRFDLGKIAFSTKSKPNLLCQFLGYKKAKKINKWVSSYQGLYHYNLTVTGQRTGTRSSDEEIWMEIRCE